MHQFRLAWTKKNYDRPITEGTLRQFIFLPIYILGDLNSIERSISGETYFKDPKFP